MSQSLIQSALASRVLARQQSVDSWAADEQTRGNKVALFRRYVDGDHRANLTTEMRKLLRIANTGSMNEFNDNYMSIIVQTMVDRLNVDRIEADTEQATDWIADLLAAARFDGMQGDTHDSAIRDGDTYVHVYWEDGYEYPRLINEPAYDGTSGVLAIHGDAAGAQPDIAIKVWRSTIADADDLTYVNVYYPDRIEKYVSTSGESLQRRAVEGEAWPAPWTLPNGEPIGVPFVHFRNRGASYDDHGTSEIENAIPLQDALNRTLYSMVMAAELTAFQIRYAVGWKPPANLTPGMWLEVSAEAPLTNDENIDIGVLEQGDIVPFIDQATWLTSEIGRITRTPAPEFSAGDNASGESLKQREIGLLGKVSRFQVSAGNAWEDVVRLAARVQQAYGMSQPPAFEKVTCKWKSAELRDDKVVIENAKVLADMGFIEEALRQMAPVFDWDETKIQALITERAQANVAQVNALFSSIPNYSNTSIDLAV